MRAWVTADAALRLVFGDDRWPAAAARQIFGVHDRITGMSGRTGTGRRGLR